MTDRPGHLWAVIQEWLDTFRYRPPSQNDLAPKFGVSPSSLSEYKYARTMPGPEFVLRVSMELQVPYERVLDAVLEDHGYRGAKLTSIRTKVAGEFLDSPGVLQLGLDPDRKAAVEDARSNLSASDQRALEDLATARAQDEVERQKGGRRKRPRKDAPDADAGSA